MVPAHPIVHEVRALSIGTDHEKRRQFTLADTTRKFDIDLVAIIEGFQRTPRRRVTIDRVTETQAAEVDVRTDRGLGFGQLVLASQGNEPILRLNP